MAIQMYTNDNSGALMAMVNKWGGNPYPHYINNRPQQNSKSKGVTMWNIAGVQNVTVHSTMAFSARASVSLTSVLSILSSLTCVSGSLTVADCAA
jgi:hypothetical protein